jgi:hypothetical protein
MVTLAGSSTLAAQPSLTDRALEWGVDFRHFNGMTGELYFSEMMGSGLAWLDFDGDGDLDLYLVQGAMLGPDKTAADGNLPAPSGAEAGDRLFRNDLAVREGGLEVRFVDVTSASGIVAEGYGMGVAVSDFDGDGRVDIYLTNFGPNQLWYNNGDGTFRDATAESGTADRSWGVSAAALDYDRDGWQDLYVGNYVDYSVAAHKTCSSTTGSIDYCSPLAYPMQEDRLFRNKGDGTFEDLSHSSGIASQPGSALGAVVLDFDGDGCVDLYVANDQMNNFLWRSRCDGTFEDVAMMAGTAVNELGQPEASMGVLADDFDGDGAVDLFMTHLTRETNTLYLNDGKGNFLDATRESGLGLPSFSATGFGVALFDVDSDGNRDLYIATGAVKRIEAQMRAGVVHALGQSDQLFLGIGGGAFREASEAVGLGERLTVGRGVAVADVDLDGDADVGVTENAGPMLLLENAATGPTHWLGVRWVDPRTGDLSVGGSVLARFGALERGARSHVDGSYASSRDPSIVLGLGAEAALGELRLEQGGRALRLASFPASRYAVLPKALRTPGETGR